MQSESLGIYSSRVCVEKKAKWSHVPWTAQGLLQPARFGSIPNSKQTIDNSQPGQEPKTTTTRVDFQKDFLLGGSDGVGHVAIEVGIATCAKGSLVLNFLTPDWVVLNLLTPDWVETHTEPAHCHGPLLLRLGTYTKPETKRTRDAHKTSPQGTTTKRQPWIGTTRSAGVRGSGLALAILVGLGWVGLANRN